MQKSQDTELLRQYVRENSDEAFAVLVSRHVNMVYSAALRKTGNPVAAEEVTQTVFVILAKKANGLLRHVALSGWLYQAARLTAANFLRTEIRRTRRNQEAYMQSLSKQTEPEIWPQILPLLEDAMGRLGEKDRNALALRFFEGKSFQEIGAAFGVSENAARKRINYALEKLRTYFYQCGVTSTTETIAGVISANSVQAAPVALAKVATAVALAKGATASSSTLTLIKGTLKVMAYKKTAVVITGVVVALLVGVTISIPSARTAIMGLPEKIENITPGQRKAAILQQMQVMKESVFPAILNFAQAHQDELPKSLAELHPYLPKDLAGIDDEHWEILQSGKVTQELVTQRNTILLQQKNVPPGKQKIIVYTDGHVEYNK